MSHEERRQEQLQAKFEQFKDKAVAGVHAGLAEDRGPNFWRVENALTKLKDVVRQMDVVQHMLPKLTDGQQLVLVTMFHQSVAQCNRELDILAASSCTMCGRNETPDMPPHWLEDEEGNQQFVCAQCHAYHEGQMSQAQLTRSEAAEARNELVKVSASIQEYINEQRLPTQSWLARWKRDIMRVREMLKEDDDAQPTGDGDA